MIVGNGCLGLQSALNAPCTEQISKVQERPVARKLPQVLAAARTRKIPMSEIAYYRQQRAFCQAASPLRS